MEHSNDPYPETYPEPDYIPDVLTETAKKRFGINYLFPYQRLVISNILEAGENIGYDPDDKTDPPSKQIVILPTGAGKSLCFMLPSILLQGPTLVVFPLLSLISDQLRRCEEAGIGAASLTGGQSKAERKAVFSGITDGSIKIVLTNPETALSEQGLPALRKCRFSHLVFDEVHTVSEWGDTFRPAYLESRRIYIEAEIPVVTAFTATASEAVLRRVKEVLFPGDLPHVVSANPDRPNIAYTVLPSLCKINSLQLLLRPVTSPHAEGAKQIITCPQAKLARRPVLIFCSTRRKTERTALQLRMRLNENEIFFYHAGLDKDEKSRIEKWFFNSTEGILCATCAYGMGIDKSGIRTVIHYDLSPSVEAYLQESGRAGRDRNPAEAILLLSPSDKAAAKLQRLSPQAAGRYAGLLRFATESKSCRRESLMRLLGAEPDTCFGCDVCRKHVTDSPPWQSEALQLLKRNRRVLSPSAAATMLCKALPELPKCDGAEIIDSLLISGEIRKILRGLWKGKLTIVRKKRLRNVSLPILWN